MTHLQAGDPAPDFHGTLDNGETTSLQDFRGRKLVLFFYPKDDTPGCTAEACSLRDNYQQLRDAGYALLGVSPDSVQKHQKFKDKYNLPFPLLADPDKEVLKAYGVWGPKKFMGKSYEGVHRVTFVIDEEGLVERVIDKVKTSDHAGQLLGY